MNKKKIATAVLRYAILIALFIGAFLLIRWFYASLTTATYEAPVPAVETVRTEERTLERTLIVTGYVEAEDTVPVTPYVEGTIVEFSVKEGDKVSEGDVIAKVDPEPYELQLAQAEAAFEAYDSSFTRVASLYEKNAVSKQEYDTLKAQRDAASAQLDLARLQLSYTDVTAKASGTVQKKISSKGSTAVKGTPIAVIADMDRLVVNIKTGEQYFDLFHRDADKLKITVTRPAGTYSEEVSTTATISYVSPYIDPTSKNFSVQVRLDDSLDSFSPGMYVKISVVYDSESGAALPARVQKLDGSAYYVEDGRAVYVDLSDTFSDGTYFIVPDEYADKDFIIKGQNSVLSGEAVNVVAEESK